MNVLEFDNVSYSFRNKSPILDRINLQLKEKEYLMILGPNGGGKTTLLQLITGLIKPDSGSVSLFNTPVTKSLNRLGYLPQQTDINHNFPISVLDVVLMGTLTAAKKKKISKKQCKSDSFYALERVGCHEIAGKRIGEISGGERQRVLLARALVSKPELLLLDEPTSNVDAGGREKLFRLFAELNKEITIVLVSHDISVISLGIKSVACINRSLHYHPAPQITEEMLKMAYGCGPEGDCSVELVAHGVPHRVLTPHPPQ